MNFFTLTKLWRVVVAAVMAACLALSIGCGGGGGKIPNGTYTGKAYGVEFSYTFSGNKLKLEALGTTTEGAYVIQKYGKGKDATYMIVLTPDGSGKPQEFGYTWESGNLKIAGTTLTKK